MFTFNKESNEISRDGKAIGIFDAQTGIAATVEILAPAFKGQVRKAIEAEGLEVKGFGIADVTGENEGKGLLTEAGATPADPLTVTGKETALAEVKRLEVQAELERKQAEALAAEAAKDTIAPAIPPAPAKCPTMGDKTPAYVEWMREYHPETYARKFKGRKHHLSLVETVK